MTKREATRGVLVLVVLALLGGGDAACNKAESSVTLPPVSTAGLAPAASNGEKDISITVNERGFSPSTVSAKKGDHLVLVFIRVSDETCATEVAFPELNLKKGLPLNQPVQVPIPTDQSRRLTFQCGMGMFKSALVID